MPQSIFSTVAHTVAGRVCWSMGSEQALYALQDIGQQSSAASAFANSGSVVQSQSLGGTQGGSVVAAGMPMTAINTVYHPSTKELRISGIGYALHCPNGLKITWQSSSQTSKPASAYSLPGAQRSPVPPIAAGVQPCDKRCLHISCHWGRMSTHVKFSLRIHFAPAIVILCSDNEVYVFSIRRLRTSKGSAFTRSPICFAGPTGAADYSVQPPPTSDAAGPSSSSDNASMESIQITAEPPAPEWQVFPPAAGPAYGPLALAAFPNTAAESAEMHAPPLAG